MIYLVLAILCSSLISIIMRLSEIKRKSDTGMFIFNYIVCVLLGIAFIPKGSLRLSVDGLGLTIGLGAISGILFLASFVLLQTNIKKNGVVLASIFMKLGVIVPVLISIIAFKEAPGILMIIGIVLAVLSIIVFNFDKKGLKAGGAAALLIILLFVSGVTDSMINIYDKVGSSELSDSFLVLVFLFAGICAAALYFIKKEKLGKWDVLFGVIIGIPNYFSSRFMLMALQDVEAVVAYPVYSVATILVISLVGIAFFKEKMSRQKIAGLVLVIAAVALLQ